MEYKSTLSIVAIILLILSLIAVAVMLKYQKSSTEWPPTTADCPDFWGKSTKRRWNRKHLCKCKKYRKTRMFK